MRTDYSSGQKANRSSIAGYFFSLSRFLSCGKSCTRNARTRHIFRAHGWLKSWWSHWTKWSLETTVSLPETSFDMNGLPPRSWRIRACPSRQQIATGQQETNLRMRPGFCVRRPWPTQTRGSALGPSLTRTAAPSYWTPSLATHAVIPSGAGHQGETGRRRVTCWQFRQRFRFLDGEAERTLRSIQR